MIEQEVNSIWRKLVNEKIGNLLAKSGVSPNVLTIAGIFASALAAFVIIQYGLVAGAFGIIVASLFDLLDGAVAKATKRTSNFGAFFDDVADRIGEIFYFGAIFWLQMSLSLFLAAATSLLVSYFKASATARGFKITSGVVTGRPARMALLFGLMLMSPWFGISSTMWLLVALNIFTIARREIEIQKQGV